VATLEEIHQFVSAYQGKAELKQDVLVLALKEFKKQGFFVEFGLMDGIYASNTYVLEQDYGWKGIVCEPAKIFHDKVRENRNCIIDFRAVTGRTGDVVEFKETDVNLGLSNIVEYNNDSHSSTRKKSKGNTYTVSTVSLIDLLDEHQAPKAIDYISIDTEGAELPVLEAFDFSKYDVDIFTIEHNYVDSVRNRILEIMTNNGYIRVFTDLSKYDDWYSFYNRFSS
jgi:FkbM family methyltransferase